MGTSVLSMVRNADAPNFPSNKINTVCHQTPPAVLMLNLIDESDNSPRPNL